jgi:hypothetical protein
MSHGGASKKWGKSVTYYLNGPKVLLMIEQDKDVELTAVERRGNKRKR